MSQPENELRAAAERLLGLIWETNFDEEVETEYERAVVALRDALASRASATTPTPEVCKCYKDNDYDFYAAVMTGVASEWTVTEDCPIHRDALAAASATTPTPPVEQLIEAARLIDLLSHEDGQPADGFRFREGVQSMRDALIQLGRAPFQDERVAQAAAPGGKERKCGHEYPLLNADCLECAKEIADDSLSRHPLQDKPPRPENEFPTGFPLHEVPSNYAIAARLRAEGKDKPPAAPAIGTIRLVKKDEDIV